LRGLYSTSGGKKGACDLILSLMTEYAAGSYQDGAKVELQEIPGHVLLEMQGNGVARASTRDRGASELP
jgi:hypothetical protein